MTTAIRALFTGLVGLLVTFGLVPEGISAAIVEHATTAVGAILVLWSLFTAHRARERQKAGQP